MAGRLASLARATSLQLIIGASTGDEREWELERPLLTPHIARGAVRLNAHDGCAVRQRDGKSVLPEWIGATDAHEQVVDVQLDLRVGLHDAIDGVCTEALAQLHRAVRKLDSLEIRRLEPGGVKVT